MWQVLKDIDELIKEEPEREHINFEEMSRMKAKRYKKEVFRERIKFYLRKHEKGISQLNREDLVNLCEWLESLDAGIMMDEVKKSLEVNYWKPLKWIIENHKSALFTNN